MVLAYDHGLIYLPKGKTINFNLHSTAYLTDETKSRHSLNDGYVSGVRAILEPKVRRNSLMEWNADKVGGEVEHQILKVTGFDAQTGEEFAIIEWFYSTRIRTSDEYPTVIHRLKFIVLDKSDENNLENVCSTFVPESLFTEQKERSVNPELEFFMLTFKLVDQTPGQIMLGDFGVEVSRMRPNGRINWSRISGFSLPIEELTYLQALNRIIIMLRDRYFNHKVTDQQIKDLISIVDQIIVKRSDDIEKFASQQNSSTNSARRHKYTLDFWKNQRKTLGHLIEDVSAATNNPPPTTAAASKPIITDDFTVGIVDSPFASNLTIKDTMGDWIAKIIIPIFIAVIVLIFWSR